MSIASPNTSKTVSTVKTTGIGNQVKKPLGKDKAVKPMEKGKKRVALVLHPLQQQLHLQFQCLT